MKLGIVLALTALGSFFTAIAWSQAGYPAAKPEVVVMYAEILECETAAAHDELEDGSTRLYDLMVLPVLPPAEYLYAGDLPIFHDSAPADESPWRRAGRRTRFEIDRDDLNRALDRASSTWLFSSSLEANLLEVEDAP
ncbi:MAG: hypothetical protein MI919_18005 [Holophagales bacterium]|nr:hypothetical protein [Holophagales bacterium]